MVKVFEQHPNIKPLYVIIHSLDMGQLKSEESVRMIAALARLDKIKLVVSLDHVKSGILFSDLLLDQLNFITIQVDTFLEFEIEMEYQPGIFSVKNEN